MTDIVRRKSEHLDTVLTKDVKTRRISAGFDGVRFQHVAAPELNLDQIDLSATLFGRPLAAPFIVSSMTGGPERAAEINAAIAEAAGRTGVAFAVGSQRVALEKGARTAGFDKSLRQRAGPVPIIGNVGAAQIVAWPDPVGAAARAIEMIDADALYVHLNPLQEAVQAGGDRNWAGLLKKLELLVRQCRAPIIVKEVGSGISANVARQLWNTGVRVIDVAGAGGTSWAAVEAERAPDAKHRAIADAFRSWGIPTAASVVAVREACPDALIIASGGIRDGVDAAKAIRLGANLVGQAAGLLAAALKGPDALTEHIEIVITQLRIACFCTGSRDLAELRSAKLMDASPHL